MRILCPNCGFAREMDLAKIPPRAQMATCPRCEHKFRFRVVDDLPPNYAKTPERAPLATRPSDLRPEPPSQPGMGQDVPSAPTPPQSPDPMAAQRAAAEQAWRHIQGVKPDSANADSANPDAPRPEAPAVGPGSPDATPPYQAPDQSPYQAPDNGGIPEPWSSRSGQQGTGSPVPFEDLPRYGFFPGLWGTIMAVIKTPTEFFRAMPVTGGMAKPLIFHLLLAEFMVLCQYFWSLTSIGAVSQLTGSQDLMDLGMGMAGAGPILILVFYPLMLILRLMLMTGIIHLILRAIFRFTGGQGFGAEATFRVLCYAAAPLVLGVVPFIGPMLGGIWSLGLTVIGLREAHRTRGSAAMFAVFLPILMILAAVLGLMQSLPKV